MRIDYKPEEGIALVLALAFIVLLTIIAVAMSSMMSIERPAAGSHLEKMRAAQMAQQGVDSLVATLDQNTADPNRQGQYWVSQPGQLIASSTVVAAASPSPTPTPNPLATTIPLCTGTPDPTATASPAYLQPANLNLPTLQDPTSHLITETAMTNPDGTTSTVPMAVNWVYITQDGTPSRTLQYDATASPPAYNWTNNANYQPCTANPVTGRYAYWADDESSKINYNLAWGKTEVSNPNPANDPTNVSLTALQDANASSFDMTLPIANALHGFITANDYSTVNRFFNTPRDARAVGTAVSSSLQQYKFQTTHYNDDPGTTVFNEPRIVLTTRPDRAGWTYNSAKGQWVGKNGQSGAAGLPHYLRILANETMTGSMTPRTPAPISGANSNLDPGPLANLDYPTSADGGAAANDTLNYLLNELQRQDWPLVPSGTTASFKTKYYSAYPSPQDKTRLAQLAINIIDYVRSKESPDTLVPPLRVVVQQPTASTFTFTLGTGVSSGIYGSYMGSSRMPFITEIGCGYKGDQVNVVVEIYCPPNYGITNTPNAIPMSSLELRLEEPQGLFADGQIGVSTSTYTDTLSSANLIPGGYVVLTRVLSYEIFSVPYQVATFPWRIALSISNGSSPERTSLTPLTDYADAGTPVTSYFLPVPFNPAAVTLGSVPSIECDDPRNSCHTGAWHTPIGVTNTFGAANSTSTLGKSPSAAVVPQQDTDANGLITGASFYMPSPAGTTANPLGCVTSVGELGYVHTGIESSTVTYSNLAVAGSPLIRLPAGVPWRTLRLQPNNSANTSTLPDWALMDLFTAPVLQQNAQAVYAPHGTSVGGRVNLNSRVIPFDIAPYNLGRTYPMTAALLGCPYDASLPATTTLSYTNANTLAGNIYSRTVSPAAHGNMGKMYGVPTGWPTGVAAPYVSPGEICEVQGVADNGENSEELVRRVENLLTVRSNVFTVYSVGQALKQTPGGSLVVTGEQRVQTMIERYNPDPTSSAVSFRPVYSCNLTP